MKTLQERHFSDRPLESRGERYWAKYRGDDGGTVYAMHFNLEDGPAGERVSARYYFTAMQMHDRPRPAPGQVLVSPRGSG